MKLVLCNAYNHKFALVMASFRAYPKLCMPASRKWLWLRD